MSQPEICAGIKSSDVNMQFLATLHCHRILMRLQNNKPMIDDIIKAGLFPRLIELLSRHDR